MITRLEKTQRTASQNQDSEHKTITQDGSNINSEAEYQTASPLYTGRTFCEKRIAMLCKATMVNLNFQTLVASHAQRL